MSDVEIILELCETAEAVTDDLTEVCSKLSEMRSRVPRHSEAWEMVNEALVRVRDEVQSAVTALYR